MRPCHRARTPIRSVPQGFKRRPWDARVGTPGTWRKKDVTMESTCPLRRPTVCMDSCVIDRPARRTPFEGGCLHTSLGVPRCECERPCFVRVSSMLVPIAVSRPSPSVLRPLSLVGRVGFVVRCGWLAFNQQIDPAFDMAYAGDRLEGRGPGPPLSVPMPLLPYGVQGSRVISDRRCPSCQPWSSRSRRHARRGRYHSSWRRRLEDRYLRQHPSHCAWRARAMPRTHSLHL